MEIGYLKDPNLKPLLQFNIMYNGQPTCINKPQKTIANFILVNYIGSDQIKVTLEGYL